MIVRTYRKYKNHQGIKSILKFSRPQSQKYLNSRRRQNLFVEKSAHVSIFFIPRSSNSQKWSD
jgi:hypothetical protein